MMTYKVITKLMSQYYQNTIRPIALVMITGGAAQNVPSLRKTAFIRVDSRSKPYVWTGAMSKGPSEIGCWLIHRDIETFWCMIGCRNKCEIRHSSDFYLKHNDSSLFIPYKMTPYHIVSFCTGNLFQILMSQSRFLEAWMVHFYHKKLHRSRYILYRLCRPPLHPPKARAGWKC